MKIVVPENESASIKTKNTGKQIQNIADLLFGLGCICAVLFGLMFFNSKSSIVGILVIAIGCYGAWASTRVLQGFGELVEDTAANRENTDRIIDILESRCGVNHETERQNTTEE